MNPLFIGNVNHIPEQSSRTLYVNNIEIAIFRLSNGEVRAIENRCPHKNGKLSEGIVCDHYVYCPLHEWKINVHDGTVQHPDEGNVLTFPVEVDEQGDMYLNHFEGLKERESYA